ncbi:MAG: hypothetical protein ACRYG7_02045 [Janthinobacterium lividum]
MLTPSHLMRQPRSRRAMKRRRQRRLLLLTLLGVALAGGVYFVH